MERVGERSRAAAGPLTRVSHAGEGTVAGAGRDLDLRGEVCPYTFLKAKLALEGMGRGEVLRVVVDNATSAQDVPRSLTGAGQTVLGAEPLGEGVWVIVVRKEA